MRSGSAVMVWELRGLVEDVTCFFLRRRGAYLLGIERAAERLLEEEYEDFPTMMARARELRSNLERVGFTPVASEAGATWRTDSLLHHFVRLGIAPLVAAGQRPS